MNKNILIICNGFYPDSSPRSFRATELVKELRRQNHQVTLMCPSKNNELDQFLLDWGVMHKDLGRLKWKIKNFENSNIIVTFINRALNRLLPKFFEYPSMELFFKVRRALIDNQNKYDLLISIAVPYTIHWGVASVWKKDKSKNTAPIWAADCGDPYFIQQNDKILTPIYFKWIEKWFMRKVDYITVPSRNSYKGYFSEFHSKLRVIPQGFRFEDIDINEPLKDGMLRFAYAGGFTSWRRDPKSILEYLTKLDSSYKFQFHIFTRDVDFVNDFCKIDSRIVLHGYIPRLELLRKLSQFDFVINLENFGESQSPSKLIDYGIINKPILSLKSFDLDIKKLEKFLHRDYSESTKISDLNNYRIENVVNNFLSFLK